jgi:hypothetical protein
VGLPEMVITDRGTEFRNKLQKRIHHIFRVNKIATTPYNARSNGCVENHNRTMKDQLYHILWRLGRRIWDIYLPTVQLMYNTTVNSATGYTPYYLLFGRACNMPGMGGVIERAHDKVTRDEGEAKTSGSSNTVYDQWVHGLVESLESAWEFTSTRAHENAMRGNRWGTSAGLEFKEYEVGDMFYRKRNQVRTFKSVQEKETYKINVKLAVRYEGPYKIVEKVN